MNEYVIFKIVISANFGEDRGIGLIVNFAAALIVCELDDIIMETSTIQYWRDRFNNYRDESSDPDENDSSKDKVTPDEEAATAATAANE